MPGVEASTPTFDIGKALQLLQSLLLVCTFFWALRERKQYRLGDKFGKYGLEYAADALDDLHSETRKDIEATLLSGQNESGAPNEIVAARLIEGFNRRLFYARTIILARLRCFSELSLKGLEDVFEELEDSFSIVVAKNREHPELYTEPIALASSKVLKMLIEHEAHISMDEQGFFQSIVAEASRKDWD